MGYIVGNNCIVTAKAMPGRTKKIRAMQPGESYLEVIADYKNCRTMVQSAVNAAQVLIRGSEFTVGLGEKENEGKIVVKRNK